MAYALRLVVCGVLIPMCAFSQEPQFRYSANTDQAGKRFQIFFSPHARADQFLVDTATGLIWQKVLNADDKDAWESVLVEQAPSVPTALQKAGRFLIVFGPQARSDAYLVDSSWGATWGQYKESKREFTFFSPIPKIKGPGM